jgi:hypothetical protein
MSKKFNLNRPAVPDEEINSHKDFGDLKRKASKRPEAMLVF